MGRLHVTAGTRYLRDGRAQVVRQVLRDGRLLVEDQSVGGEGVVTRAELTAAWAEGRLRFEVPGPAARASGGAVLATAYTIADFHLVAEGERAEAWRRYTLIRPLLALPPHERTRRTIAQHLVDARMRHGPNLGGGPGAVSRTSVEGTCGLSHPRGTSGLARARRPGTHPPPLHAPPPSRRQGARRAHTRQRSSGHRTGRRRPYHHGRCAPATRRQRGYHPVSRPRRARERPGERAGRTPVGGAALASTPPPRAPVTHAPAACAWHTASPGASPPVPPHALSSGPNAPARQHVAPDARGQFSFKNGDLVPQIAARADPSGPARRACGGGRVRTPEHTKCQGDKACARPALPPPDARRARRSSN